MKTLIFTVATLFIAAIAPRCFAAQPSLKAEIIGTVQTQTILSPTNGRIHTAVLNNKRVFEEYQVSQSDYELVFNLNGGGGLELIPKHASSGLPTIVVVVFGSTGAEAINTKTRIIAFTASIGTNTATNLFKDLAGELAGSVHFNGSLSSPVFSKIALSALASGTDTVGGSGAILKFKVTAKGVFTQAP